MILGLLGSLPIAESHARTAIGLVNEFGAGDFQITANVELVGHYRGAAK